MKHGIRAVSVWLVAFVWLGLLCAPKMVQAQYVRGSKVNMKIIQPMELEGKELARYSLFSIADALRYNSGLLFKDYGGLAGLKTINVRSFGSERTGVFYNGIEVGNAMNGQVDLSRFGMAGLGSLALYSGQRGDIYQSATDFASSNSLYIDTRRPRFRGENKTNFSATLKGGSFLTVNPSLMYEHSLGHGMSTSFNFDLLSSNGEFPYSLKRYDANGKEMFDVRGDRKNDKIHAIRAEGALHGTFSKGLWNVYAYSYTSQRGVPGAIINQNLSYRGENLTERSYFLQGNVKFFVSKKYKTQLNYKFSEDYTRYENNDEKLVKVDDAFSEYSIYLSNSHLYNFSEMWQLSGAYDLLYNKMDKRNEITRSAAKDFAHPWRLKHLGSLAGRFSWKGVQASASVYGTFVQNFGEKALNPYGNEKAISPAVLVSYKPFSIIPFYVQGFVKQSYRVPNYNDRYISMVQGDMLKPETLTQYDLGLMYEGGTDGKLRKLSFSVEGYYNDVKDKIIAYPTGQLYRWTMTNLGKVRVIGGDAAGMALFRFSDSRQSPLFKTKLQYTYQKAQDVTNPDDTYYNQQIPYIPWNSGSAIFSLIWKGWTLNYSFLYVGERYSRQENIPYYKMQPWYNHDVSLEKMIKFSDWNLRCMLEVNNVLGQDFEIVTNYPMPKQFVRMTVNVEI